MRLDHKPNARRLQVARYTRWVINGALVQLRNEGWRLPFFLSEETTDG